MIPSLRKAIPREAVTMPIQGLFEGDAFYKRLFLRVSKSDQVNYCPFLQLFFAILLPFCPTLCFSSFPCEFFFFVSAFPSFLTLPDNYHFSTDESNHEDIFLIEVS